MFRRPSVPRTPSPLRQLSAAARSRRNLGIALILIGGAGLLFSGFTTWRALARRAAAVDPVVLQPPSQSALPPSATPAAQPAPAAVRPDSSVATAAQLQAGQLRVMAPPAQKTAGPAAAEPIGAAADPAPAATAAPAATLPPATPAAAPPPAPLRAFTFDYTFDPPGRREWSQRDSATWVQRLPDGSTENFVRTDTLTLDRVPGVIVRPEHDSGVALEIFIPNAAVREKLGRWIRFRHRTPEWRFLGELTEKS